MCKNESIGAEMIEILQIIQEKYVPKKVVQNDTGKTTEILSKIFVGGDQLSEEKLDMHKEPWLMEKQNMTDLVEYSSRMKIGMLFTICMW